LAPELLGEFFELLAVEFAAGERKPVLSSSLTW
jgi:hypothetical protein